MKKLFALLLALAMLLLSASALAETPAETLLDAGEDLLFHTENVTLTGEAVFFLDDLVFKTADAVYIQDGENSFWQLKLRTPRPTDPELGDKESGYTIIANGDQVYVMEVLQPGVYRSGSLFPQRTILRESVQLDLMAKLLRSLAKQADTLLGENAFTVTDDDRGGREIRIVLDENVPDLANTALTVLFEYVGTRYFDIDYDQLSDQYMGVLANYISPTRGILYTTEYIYLKQADVTVSLDASGNLQRVSGAVAVYLQTGGDGAHQLDITFSLDVTDRGSSKVEPFDPAQYGVVPAGRNSAPQVQDPEQPEEPEEGATEAVIDAARKAAKLAGYPFTETMDGYAMLEADGWVTVGLTYDPMGMFLTCIADTAGTVIRFCDQNCPYLDSFPLDDLRSDEYPDEAVVAETTEKLNQFLEAVHPDAFARVGELRMDSWFEADGAVYFCYEEYPHQLENSVIFLVRVLPEWWIEDYSCINNG